MLDRNDYPPSIYYAQNGFRITSAKRLAKNEGDVLFISDERDGLKNLNEMKSI
jgi:hypothetical protein